MDNVLFYGERDEQTRRHVRSAAAAHSHRIGPRKPKAAVTRHKQQQQQQKKNHLVATQKCAPAPAPAPTAVVSSATNISNSVREEYRPVPPVDSLTQPELPQMSSLQQAPGVGIGHHTHMSDMMHSHSLPRRAPEQAHMSPGLHSISPAHPPTSPDSVQRLPQYSWTEYPRYSVQLRDMLADVASSAPDASALRSPAAQPIPGLRHFDRAADGRPILPPLLVVDRKQQTFRGDRQAKCTDAEPPPRQPATNPCLDFLQYGRPHFSPLSPG